MKCKISRLPSKKQNKTCRISFFLGCTNPYSGGGWTRISSLAEYLVKKGFSVDVVGIFSIKDLNKAGGIVRRGIRIFNITPTFSYSNPIFSIFDLPVSIITLAILFLILRPKLLIISVPGVKILTPIGAYIGGKVSKAKIIFDYRDEWEDITSKAKLLNFALKLVKHLMSLFYLNSSIVIVDSPKFINGLKKRGVTKIKLIFTGTDVETIKPYNKKLIKKELGLPQNAFTVVYNGLVGGCYRLDIVVKALSKIKENAALLIIGTGPDIERVLSLANNIGVRVYYLGIKNDAREIAKTLSAADVGIIPYDANLLWKNTLPTKFFEYCACGLPLAATAHNDSLIAAIIKAYQIGVVSPPLSEEKLADALNWLCQNKEFREAAGKRARKLIEKKFDRNKLLEEFLNVIEAML